MSSRIQASSGNWSGARIPLVGLQDPYHRSKANRRRRPLQGRDDTQGFAPTQRKYTEAGPGNRESLLSVVDSLPPPQLPAALGHAAPSGAPGRRRPAAASPE